MPSGLNSRAEDVLRNGLDSFYRGRQARDRAVRTAAAAGISADEIAQVCSMSPARVREILHGDAEVTLLEPLGSRLYSCTYCKDTGKIESARACSCKLPNGSCDRTCEDGWIYVFDFCGHCDAGSRR